MEEEKEKPVKIEEKDVEETKVNSEKKLSREKIKEAEKPEERKETKEEKKERKEEKVKKDKAIAKGKDLSISTKQSVAICRFIKNKNIEKAILELERVIRKEIAIPMKGEIPHRKKLGRGGRYPVKACKIFVKLLRGLNANSQVSELENPYISIAKSDIASRPYKRFGSRRFKRTNVYLEARDVKKEEK